MHPTHERTLRRSYGTVVNMPSVIVWFPSALMATSSLYFVPPVRTSGRTLRRSPAPILIASVDRGVCSQGSLGAAVGQCLAVDDVGCGAAEPGQFVDELLEVRHGGAATFSV